MYSFLYFLAALGLGCCVWVSLAVGHGGLFSVHRLLIEVASLVAETGSRGVWAQ